MAYLSRPYDYVSRPRDGISSPQSRVLADNYSLAAFDPSRRAVLPRPLIENASGDFRGRHLFHGGDDPATIDREGPYVGNSLLRRCRSHPHLYDDGEAYSLSDLGRQMPYSFPLSCTGPGGLRWGLDQIQAYNRHILHHNSSLARRRPFGAPGEHLLYPIMDSVGRFPPGFDRPMKWEDFFGFEEPIIDSHRHHFGLPLPEMLESLLMVNSAERQLKHHLKQIQLLELYGAKRLAEQLGLQLLAAQNVLQGLSLPRGVGYDLGPEFDENYLSSSMRGAPNATVPLDAIGYGNGIANWNFPLLYSQLRNPRPVGGSAAGNPWARPGLYPGQAGQGMGRSLGYHGSLPGLSYGGGGAFGEHGPYGMSMGGPSNGIGRDLERISYDGGRGRRSGRFN